MQLHILVPFEGFATNVTHVWFFTCMNGHMMAELSLVSKTLRTNRTFTLLPIVCKTFMNNFMSPEIHTFRECFTTDITFMWLMIIVRTFSMCCKIAILCEALVTNVTLEWLFTSMPHLMCFENAPEFEMFGANITCVCL